MLSIFNSMSQRHKEPFGAVKAGTKVRLSLTPHRSLSACGGSAIIVCENTASGMDVPLKWDGLDGGCDVFSAEINTSDFLGPVWYTFRLELSDSRTFYIGRSKNGEGVMFPSHPHDNLFQLTVYDGIYDTPSWYGEGITYQIFPDRFRKAVGAVSGDHDRKITKDWLSCPPYKPDHNNIWNDEFFGGNFEGIIEKLPYLKKMNVTTIYLNPIFESVSSHRYDTGDYLKADPLLGSNEDFARLCKKASKLGMRVMLDGVFSHTGYNSIYFNALGKYPSVGAAQSKNSPYYGWYMFERWPDKYSAWWGVYSLPQVDETNPDYRAFIYKNEDSVIRRWTRLGVSGWRLDVADELPDEFIEELRETVRSENPDAVLIGEVWEDASNKISYSKRRKYFWGKELDSVMNYPFRDSLLAYIRGGNARDFMETMETIRENYPNQAFMSLMNHIGTHDTPRALTILGHGDGGELSRDQKSGHRLKPEKYDHGVRLLRIASLVQYTFPGSPCVYYGDEAGMEGFEDPFNRRGYPWGHEDSHLVDWYVALGKLREQYQSLRKGSIRFLKADGPLLCYERSHNDETVIVMTNRGDDEALLEIFDDGHDFFDVFSGDQLTPERDDDCIEISPLSCLAVLKKPTKKENPKEFRRAVPMFAEARVK